MKVSVGKYALTPSKLLAGTVGSYGFERLRFVFDDFWRPLTKRILFAPPEGKQISLLLTSDEVTLPREVCRTEGVCRFALVGSEGERVIVTLTGELFVLQTLPLEGDAPEDATPSLLDQILVRVQHAEASLAEALERLNALEMTQRRRKTKRSLCAPEEGEAKGTLLIAGEKGER